MDPAGTEKIIRDSASVRAVIAVPPVRDFYFTPSRASALGAEALRQALKKTGVEAKLCNFPLMKKKPARLPLPEELMHLKPHLLPGESGPVSFFSAYHRFGPSFDDCAEIIASDAGPAASSKSGPPGYVFIPCFAWAYAAETEALALAVRKRLPEARIFTGGAGVTVNPNWFESRLHDGRPVFDLILPGEAETLFTAAPSCGDSPPFIWRETGVSRRKKIRYISAILTRGCPKACRFCSNHLVHGRKFRKARLEDIRSGMDEIPDDLNLHVNFEDDNLLFAGEYFMEVLGIIKQRFPAAEFSAENGLDYTLMDEDTVGRLIKTGFRSFNLSMASSSESLLENEKRRGDGNRLEKVLEAAAAGGAASTAYFICGLDGDSPATVIDNLLALHRLPALTGISMFYPVPGLPGFPPEEMSLHPPRLCAGSSAWPWTGSLTTAQMITAFRLSRLSNLIKTLEGRITGSPAAGNALADSILNTGKLHTLVNGNITEVPDQDHQLVKDFLQSI